MEKGELELNFVRLVANLDCVSKFTYAEKDTTKTYSKWGYFLEPKDMKKIFGFFWKEIEKAQKNHA